MAIRGSTVSFRLSFGAFLALGCFFLPWLEIVGESASGFQLARLGPPATWVLLFPALALAAIALGKTTARRWQAVAVLLVGALPLFALWYCWRMLGDGVFGTLRFGAYLLFVASLACLASGLRTLVREGKTCGANLRNSQVIER